MKKLAVPLFLWLLFEAIAVTLWLALDNLFYLINFSYIGSCLALGIFLYSKKVRFARNLVQAAVGLYMLVYLGIFSNENMQIEGFWYYLFLGVFEAAVIHYLVAKLLGPFLFGRGWCGYACWTAMALDLLPYKTLRQDARDAQELRKKRLGYIRYLVFLTSLLFVGALFVFHVPNLERVMLYSFLIGNALYYGTGILLAFLLKDNRAFCKYICPITVFLKPASYFSLLRVKLDKDKCVSCGKCLKACPMQVDMLDASRSRCNGTECILCLECIRECPKQALHL